MYFYQAIEKSTLWAHIIDSPPQRKLVFLTVDACIDERDGETLSIRVTACRTNE